MTTKRPSPVDADLYDKFVIEAGRRFGATAGSVKRALEQAMQNNKAYGCFSIFSNEPAQHLQLSRRLPQMI
jgi:hypothetical protein